jgi:hypothetical protein
MSEAASLTSSCGGSILLLSFPDRVSSSGSIESFASECQSRKGKRDYACVVNHIYDNDFTLRATDLQTHRDL